MLESAIFLFMPQYENNERIVDCFEITGPVAESIEKRGDSELKGLLVDSSDVGDGTHYFNRVIRSLPAVLR